MSDYKEFDQMDHESENTEPEYTEAEYTEPENKEPEEASAADDSFYHYSYRKTQQDSGEAYSPIPPEPPKPKPRRKRKAKKNRLIKNLMRVAAYGLVFGIVASVAFHGVEFGMKKIGISSGGATQLAPTSTAKPSSGGGDLTNVAENVLPSIVSINGVYETKMNNFWFGETTQESEGSGSGIIIAKDSKYIYVATNNHVVENSKSLAVGFCDETTAEAEIKGTDSDADLAVVEVPLSKVKDSTLAAIKIITLGDSDKLKVGERAIAIGNALGYGQSVTGGYISAVNREVELTDKTMTLIQTDAAINPGNSGGALLNGSGELVGINTIKFSSEEVEGMGYAIPVNIAYPIIKDLINEETIPESKQAYMGITGTDITQEMAQAYEMPKGIYIREIQPGSPAQKAGMQAGDVLVKFDGKDVISMESLQAKLAKKKAGTKVKVVVKRQSQMGDYNDTELSITLGAKSSAQK